MNLLIPVFSPYCITYPHLTSFRSLSPLKLTALQVVVAFAAIVREYTCVEFLIS